MWAKQASLEGFPTEILLQLPEVSDDELVYTFIA